MRSAESVSEVRMTRFLTMTVLALSMASGVAFADTSMDVTPLRVQVHTKPGAEYTNAVQVTNSGAEPLRLRAYTGDWYLDEQGKPLFLPAGSLPQTASLWVEATPSDLLLDPGETEFVRFTISVPPDAAEGGFHTSLLLETLPLNRAEKRTRQMFVQGRVACMLYVTVGEPPQSARINSLVLVERQEKHYLRMLVENTGQDFIRLAGGVDFVTGGRTLGEPLEMPDVPVLPGAKRWVEFEVASGMLVENTSARVILDLGSAGAVVGECPLEAPLVGDNRVGSRKP
jgi:hypothetical protein